MSGVTFKCKQTGNTVTFRDAHDIDGLRKHPDYEEVIPQYEGVRVVLPSHDESLPTYEQSLSQEEQPIVKRMGRPKKEQ
jgi:hypothetical protein